VNILYLGSMSGTSLDRAAALRRLGYTLEHIDPRALLPRTVWVDRLLWRLGGDWFTPWILRGLQQQLAGKLYSLCYVDAGHLIAPGTLDVLRQHAATIVNYNIDDPLGPRDGARNRAYRRCVPRYDLCVVMREVNVAEARALGARNVMRVYMSADEVSHAPRKLSAHDLQAWSSEVLFLGTWFPERGPFLLELIKRGVPLTIRGANWAKAPEWDALRGYWKGGALQGDDYAKAIQCAKVNLGLLSVMNRDLHTTRWKFRRWGACSVPKEHQSTWQCIGKARTRSSGAIRRNARPCAARPWRTGTCVSRLPAQGTRASGATDTTTRRCSRAYWTS
jgi:hypothetical protein